MKHKRSRWLFALALCQPLSWALSRRPGRPMNLRLQKNRSPHPSPHRRQKPLMKPLELRTLGAISWRAPVWTGSPCFPTAPLCPRERCSGPRTTWSGWTIPTPRGPVTPPDIPGWRHTIWVGSLPSVSSPPSMWFLVHSTARLKLMRAWENQLTEDQRQAIALAIAYGYPNCSYAAASRDGNTAGIIESEKLLGHPDHCLGDCSPASAAPRPPIPVTAPPSPRPSSDPGIPPTSRCTRKLPPPWPPIWTSPVFLPGTQIPPPPGSLSMTTIPAPTGRS